jgi:ribosomal protein S18 acetylase RimI-like enzyme
LLQPATAVAASRDRMWLTATNDNLDALRFYQRRGFQLAALRRGRNLSRHRVGWQRRTGTG